MTVERARGRDRRGAGFGVVRRLGHGRLAIVLVLGLAAAATVAAILVVQSQAGRRATIVQRFDTRHTTASRFINAYTDQAEQQQIRLASSQLTGPVSAAHFDEITTQFSTAVLLDASGRILAISPPDASVIGQRVDTRVEALHTALSGLPAVSNIVTTVAGAPPVLGFAVPFETHTGRRVFAGGYTIANTPLRPYVVSALSTYRTAHVYLVDATGIVISTDRSDTSGQTLARAAPALARAMAAHPSGFLGSRAHQQYFITGTVEGTEWKLVFMLDTKELFVTLTPAERWTPRLALLGFVLMGLGIIALFLRALAGRAQAENERASQQSILDTASDAFIGMNEKGLVTDWNTAAVRLLGWSGADALGQPVATLMVPPRDRDSHTGGLHRFLETGIARLPTHPIALTAQHRDGHEIPVELTVSRNHWQGSWRFHAFIRDITDRVEHERQLQDLALTDSLTGLANRRAFMVNLEQAHARAGRHGSELAVVYADVDQFKSINDTYGHTAGDAVLVQIAERLEGHFRTEDTVGRLGGDEFAVVCEDFTTSGHNLVERLHDLLAIPYIFRGQPILATVSVGLATPQNNESVAHLLERADTIMYEAKADQQRS